MLIINIIFLFKSQLWLDKVCFLHQILLCLIPFSLLFGLRFNIRLCGVFLIAYSVSLVFSSLCILIIIGSCSLGWLCMNWTGLVIFPPSLWNLSGCYWPVCPVPSWPVNACSAVHSVTCLPAGLSTHLVSAVISCLAS